MKNEAIINALAEVDDEFINEYADCARSRNRLKKAMGIWAAAAGFIVTFAAVFSIAAANIGVHAKDPRGGWIYDFHSCEELAAVVPEGNPLLKLTDCDELWGVVKENETDAADISNYWDIYVGGRYNGDYYSVRCSLKSEKTAREFASAFGPITFGADEVKSAEINGTEIWFSRQSGHYAEYDNHGYFEEWNCAFDLGEDMYYLRLNGDSVSESEFMGFMEMLLS